MKASYVYAAIAAAALVTIFLRALPFLLLGKKGELPPLVQYLGKVLPSAVMAMLVVYCLKDLSFASLSGWLPALLSCGLTAALQYGKRNSLLSILCGTLCYMLLVQRVFV